MRKVFWDHLIEIEEIKIKIEEFKLSQEEKNKLIHITYETFDMHILETILTHLPKEKHRKFLDHFSKMPYHPKVLDLLKKDVKDIEEKIKIAGQKIKKEILAELHKP